LVAIGKCAHQHRQVDSRDRFDAAGLASQYSCEVWVSRNQRRVNAKSIMGVMMLAAGKGSKITIETFDGPDEEEAMTALVALVADKFGEGE
jgi:phosphocarrier protein